MSGSATVCLALLIMAVPACATDGFECGSPLRSDDAIVRKCGNPREVCVCATSSCAERTTADICPSTLRYVASPFAREDVAGKCVVEGDTGWIIKEAATDLHCPAQRPEPDAAPAPDAAEAGDA